MNFDTVCQIIASASLNWKLDWDCELEKDLKECFLTWWRGLEALRELKIPRWMGGGLLCSLHMFCDASADAYAVVFLRAEDTKSVTVQPVQAKCRVAPLKKPTLPRLELLAASVGARLVQSVMEALRWKQVPVFFMVRFYNCVGLDFTR